MNDVNDRDASISTSGADEARGRKARALSVRLDQADCAGGGTFRFLSRPCGRSGPTAPAAPSSETCLRLVPQVSRCRSRRSASDFVRFFRTSSTPQPSRTCRPRRSHANDVDPQQPRHVHKPPAHKGVRRPRLHQPTTNGRDPLPLLQGHLGPPRQLPRIARASGSGSAGTGCPNTERSADSGPVAVRPPAVGLSFTQMAGGRSSVGAVTGVVGKWRSPARGGSLPTKSWLCPSLGGRRPYVTLTESVALHRRASGWTAG